MTPMTKLFAAAAAMTCALNATAGTSVSEATVFDVQSNVPSTLTLDGFDTHLGKLTSVQFELHDRLSGYVELANLGNKSADFTANLTGVLHTAYGDISAVSNNVFTIDAQDELDTNLPLATQAYTRTFTAPAELQMFLNGSLALSVTGKVSPFFSGPANASYYSEGTIDAYAKVTYTYETAPVPEPETYAMLLAGLGLVGAIARRRKSA
ncbi:FxDxF family PEP-CTERM protein [Pseudoduganella danionis]|uniref:FxDxF family PEP-CTERM protein n=1 Tax=Pseudoduganella danionis TaxID=1890295 RepID=UPI00280AB444|nr:FxDxF family PEP-CTERM protein [Pseudoduganella danionis]